MDSQAIQPGIHHYYSNFNETAKTLPQALQVFLQVNDLYHGNMYAYRDSEYVFHTLFGRIDPRMTVDQQRKMRGLFEQALRCGWSAWVLIPTRLVVFWSPCPSLPEDWEGVKHFLVWYKDSTKLRRRIIFSIIINGRVHSFTGASENLLGRRAQKSYTGISKKLSFTE